MTNPPVDPLIDQATATFRDIVTRHVDHYRHVSATRTSEQAQVDFIAYLRASDRTPEWMAACLTAAVAHIAASPTDEDLQHELRMRQQDYDRTRDALLPILAEHPLTRDEVAGYDQARLRAGWLAKQAAELLRTLLDLPVEARQKDEELEEWRTGVRRLPASRDSETAIREISEAIPPAYTRWIGARLLAHVRSTAAAAA
ncbi:hypothetical protein ACFXGA_06330 [Actinosynnema sp. NPDC059335]|uniref:hypothetical protein n=1 Tax=Actinosynnema sp. NPDC059335 TaxID=3346804 RepID=UPI0036728831